MFDAELGGSIVVVAVALGQEAEPAGILMSHADDRLSSERSAIGRALHGLAAVGVRFLAVADAQLPDRGCRCEPADLKAAVNGGGGNCWSP